MRCVDLYNQAQSKWFEEMVTTSLVRKPAMTFFTHNVHPIALLSVFYSCDFAGLRNKTVNFTTFAPQKRIKIIPRRYPKKWITLIYALTAIKQAPARGCVLVYEAINKSGKCCVCESTLCPRVCEVGRKTLALLPFSRIFLSLQRFLHDSRALLLFLRIFLRSWRGWSWSGWR